MPRCNLVSVGMACGTFCEILVGLHDTVCQIGIRTERVTWLIFYIQSALGCDNGLVIAVIRRAAE